MLLVFTSAAKSQAEISSGNTVVPMMSMKPLAMIYAALSPDNIIPHVFLHGRTNVHDYQLSVSDIRVLQQQRIFYWMGPEQENYLAKLAPRLTNTAEWHQLTSQTNHSWLSRQGIALLTNQIADTLTVAFNAEPDKSNKVDANVAHFTQALAERYRIWQQQFEPYHQQAFLLGHAAFVQFAKDMGLENAQVYRSGHNHGHAASGLNELIRIQQAIAKKDIYCAVQEPDVSFKQLQQRYPHLKLINLEPMADSIPLSASAYIDFIDSTATLLLQCLRQGK